MRAALVVNPTKVEDAGHLRARAAAHSAEHGWDEPLWFDTTKADPGTGMAQQCLAAKADLVLSCGGDGTVMAVVTGLSHSGVPLGILPAGTGNLLARNLGLPLDLDEALEVAFTGTDRTIDVGVIGEKRFAVMAGVGLDAHMMSDAPDRLKRWVGWPAYVVSGARHLLDREMVVGIKIDDGPPLTVRARTVLVGNVGTLQGGMELLPDAAPDDGILDVVVVSPRGVRDWTRVAARIVTRGERVDRRLDRHRGKRVEIRTTEPQPYEMDGDPSGMCTSLVIEVASGALVVRVPPGKRS